MQSSLLPSRCDHRLRQSDDVSGKRFPGSSSRTHTWTGCQELPASIPTGGERGQDCSMGSQTPLHGCCRSQAPLLQARLEPCRNLWNWQMAATRGEGGQMHLEILGFLTQGRGLSKGWASAADDELLQGSDTWPPGRRWSQRFHWEERGIKIQTYRPF